MGFAERARRWVIPIIKWLFAAAVLVFGVSYIAGRWDEVSRAFARMNPGLLAAAFALTLAALVLSLLSWRVLWPAFHTRLGLRHASRVFYVSQLGKYLPGSVWPIAAQAQMAKQAGVSRAASVVLSLISMVVSIAVGLAIGAVLVPFIDSELLVRYWWLVVVGLILVACLLPPVLTRLVALATRVLRRPRAAFSYTGAIALRSAGFQAGTWVAGGLHLWLIVVALGGDPTHTLIPCLAAFPLGFCVGILLVPVPAGLGVREFVLTLMLSAVTANSIALLAAVVSRVLYAVGDFVMAGAAMAAARQSADDGDDRASISTAHSS